MPKAKSKESKSRGRAVAVVDEPAERGLMLRILLHSPKDLVAGLIAFAAVSAIIANAIFLQAGRHPSPMFGSSVVVAMPAPFVNPLPKPRPIDATLRPADARLDSRMLDSKPVDGKADSKPDARAAAAAAAVARPPAAVPTVARDPLGDLIVSSRRVAAVQRALTEFGYGQLKPTGTAGSDTQAAIQRFERERKLPVTGQVNDRMVRELASVTGRPIE
ncbi:peptidoglycan-binding domain-containing protein [Tardiphaga sp.]|uniref:peptidoglycan-binding domain-containing protein n=1 Tax=Tardiphaga sp. TaxID=1926292 RepID=UPI0025FE10D1|nr:peptidoglycan-binding domain-containing protein [Tardiphaga sp.]